jgi:hypothetical protein
MQRANLDSAAKNRYNENMGIKQTDEIHPANMKGAYLL